MKIILTSILLNMNTYLSNSVLYSQTEDDFKRDIYNIFLNLENELVNIDNQIIFMGKNDIYDLKKMKDLSQLLNEHKEAYEEIMKAIYNNNVYDEDYEYVSELYRSELNDTIEHFRMYKTQFIEYDKSERSKMLLESIEELFKGFK